MVRNCLSILTNLVVYSVTRPVSFSSMILGGSPSRVVSRLTQLLKGRVINGFLIYIYI